MSIYDDLPERETLDGVWRAIIATPAASANDPVFVTITAFDNKHRFGPCRWVTKEAILPSRGDDCLVVFADDQRPYVIAWWE